MDGTTGTVFRLGIGAVLPAPTAALLMVIERVAEGGVPVLRFALPEFALLTLAAFPFIAAQSVLYSAAMEFLVNRRVESHFVVVLLGGVMGLASGATLGTSFLPLGASVGAVVAIALRVAYCCWSTAERSGDASSCEP